MTFPLRLLVGDSSLDNDALVTALNDWLHEHDPQQSDILAIPYVLAYLPGREQIRLHDPSDDTWSFVKVDQAAERVADIANVLMAHHHPSYKGRTWSVKYVDGIAHVMDNYPGSESEFDPIHYAQDAWDLITTMATLGRVRLLQEGSLCSWIIEGNGETSRGDTTRLAVVNAAYNNLEYIQIKMI